MTDAVTKTCNLTEDEIWAVIQYHSRQIANSGPHYDAPIERLKYLNGRVKAFKEPEIKIGDKQGNSAEAITQGWPTNG